MPDTATLLWGVLCGSIGLGYYMWGKRRQQPVARWVGIALIVYPYFIANPTALLVVGLLLMGIPFVIKT